MNGKATSLPGFPTEGHASNMILSSNLIQIIAPSTEGSQSVDAEVKPNDRPDQMGTMGTLNEQDAGVFKKENFIETLVSELVQLLTAKPTYTPWLGYLMILLEDSQLLWFSWRGDMGLQMPSPVIETLFNPIIRAQNSSYTVYIVFFIMCIAFISHVLASMSSLYLKIKKGVRQPEFYWTSLKFTFETFFSLFFIPAMHTLFYGLRCTAIEGSSSSSFDLGTSTMIYQPDVACFTSLHIIPYILSVIFAPVYIILSYLILCVFSDSLPRASSEENYNIVAKSSTVFDAHYMLSKLILCITYIFTQTSASSDDTSGFAVRFVVLFVAQIYIMYQFQLRQPFYADSTNYVRGAMFGVSLGSILLILVARLTRDQTSTPVMFYTMAGLSVLWAALGALTVRLTRHYICKQVFNAVANHQAKSIKGATLSTKQVTKTKDWTKVLKNLDLYLDSKPPIKQKRLSRATDADLACRFIIENPTIDGLRVVNHILTVATEEYPRDFNLALFSEHIIAHQNVIVAFNNPESEEKPLASVEKALEEATNCVLKTRHLAKGWLGFIKRVIVSIEKLRLKRMLHLVRSQNELKLEELLSDTSKISIGDRDEEIDEIQERATGYHLDALKAKRSFWSYLHGDQVNQATITFFAGRICAYTEQAEEQYTRLLALEPSNKNILRMYASFLSEVKNDSAEATYYIDLASQVERRALLSGIKKSVSEIQEPDPDDWEALLSSAADRAKKATEELRSAAQSQMQLSNTNQIPKSPLLPSRRISFSKATNILENNGSGLGLLSPTTPRRKSIKEPARLQDISVQDLSSNMAPNFDVQSNMYLDGSKSNERDELLSKVDSSDVSGSQFSRETRQRKLNRSHLETRITKSITDYARISPLVGLLSLVLVIISFYCAISEFSNIEKSTSDFLAVSQPRDLSIVLDLQMRRCYCLASPNCPIPPIMDTYESCKEQLTYYSKLYTDAIQSILSAGNAASPSVKRPLLISDLPKGGMHYQKVSLQNMALSGVFHLKRFLSRNRTYFAAAESIYDPDIRFFFDNAQSMAQNYMDVASNGLQAYGSAAKTGFMTLILLLISICVLMLGSLMMNFLPMLKYAVNTQKKIMKLFITFTHALIKEQVQEIDEQIENFTEILDSEENPQMMARKSIKHEDDLPSENYNATRYYLTSYMVALIIFLVFAIVLFVPVLTEISRSASSVILINLNGLRSFYSLAVNMMATETIVNDKMIFTRQGRSIAMYSTLLADFEMIHGMVGKGSSSLGFSGTDTMPEWMQSIKEYMENNRACAHFSASGACNDDSFGGPYYNETFGLTKRTFSSGLDVFINLFISAHKRFSAQSYQYFDQADYILCQMMIPDLDKGVLKLNELILGESKSNRNATRTATIILFTLTIISFTIFNLFLHFRLLRRLKKDMKNIATIMYQMPSQISKANVTFHQCLESGGASLELD